MAVNFGATNGSRYYSVPDNAEFTLPNGDWTWIFIAKHQTVNFPKYFISTGALGTANSFNGYITASGVGDRLQIGYNALAGGDTPDAMAANTFHVVYITRRSDNIYYGTVPVGGASASEVVSPIGASGTTSNGTSLLFAARVDLQVDRFLRGAISWIAFLPGKGLSSTEAVALADGSTVLMTSAYSGTVQNLWDFSTSSASTITDIISGKVATKNGTGYGTDEADPLPYGVTSTKGITLQLFDGASNVGALTGVQAAFFDQAEPKDFLAPVFKTSTATTSASGIITLNVDAETALSIGQNGCLVLYKLDGTDHRLSRAIVTRAAIVDIS